MTKAIRSGPEWSEYHWTNDDPPFVPRSTLDVPGVRLVDGPTTSLLRVPRNAENVVQLPCDPPNVRYLPADAVMPARALFPHQREAANKIVTRGCLLLADDLGLGKTSSAAVAAESVSRAHQNRPVVILAPKYLRASWKRELTALGLLKEEKEWLALEGKSGKLIADPSGVRWIFVHPEIAHSWQVWLGLIRPVVAIVDEAHLYRNPRSLRGKAAEMVANGALMRTVLTATPVPNRLSEMHHLLSLVTGPWTWGTWVQFCQRYCGGTHSGYGWSEGDPTNTDELQRRLEGVYLRRTKEEVGLNLPPLTRQVITVDMDEASIQKYQVTLGGYEPKAIVRALLEGRASERALEYLMALRKITSRAKERSTAEHVRSLLDQGENVVVFTWERKAAERLGEMIEGDGDGRTAYVIHGGIDQQTRDALVESFQTSAGRGTFVVATYGALGVGVTLTKARCLVLHDLDWVPATMLQGEGRVHRIGSTRNVQSFWMCAKDTIDEIIAKLVTRKAEAIAAIGDQAPRSLAELFGAEFDDVKSVDDLVRWSETW